MKIERGILGTNSSNELIVISPMNIYKISLESLLEREFRSNEKLLGVVIDGIFHRCDDFYLNNEKKMFGYIKKYNFNDSVISIQIIDGFDRQTFNPYNSFCNLGKEVRFFKNEITTHYNNKLNQFIF